MLPGQPNTFAPVKRTSLAELNAIYEQSLVNERTQKLFAYEAELWGERAQWLVALDAPVEAGEAARVAAGFARLAGIAPV